MIKLKKFYFKKDLLDWRNKEIDKGIKLFFVFLSFKSLIAFIERGFYERKVQSC